MEYPGLAEKAEAETTELVRPADAEIFPMLDESGRPVVPAKAPTVLRPASGCPEQTAALRFAGVEVDAYAGLRCPKLEAIEGLIASGAPIRTR